MQTSDESFAEQEIEIGERTSEKKESEKGKILVGTYPLKYLNLCTKSSGLCPTVEIYLKETFPLLLMYSVANLGQIRFGIAPKVTDC